jgi:hypothetical protein
MGQEFMGGILSTIMVAEVPLAFEESAGRLGVNSIAADTLNIERTIKNVKAIESPQETILFIRLSPVYYIIIVGD